MADDVKDYEMVVLFHPDLEIDLDKALKKVEGIVKDNKGKITKTDNWGKRKLAYKIKKQEHAVYTYYELSVPAENVANIRDTLNITNEVVRYLVTQPVPEVTDERDDSDGEKAESRSKAKTTDNKSSKKLDDSESSDDTKEE